MKKGKFMYYDPFVSDGISEAQESVKEDMFDFFIKKGLIEEKEDINIKWKEEKK